MNIFINNLKLKINFCHLSFILFGFNHEIYFSLFQICCAFHLPTFKINEFLHHANLHVHIFLIRRSTWICHNPAIFVIFKSYTKVTVNKLLFRCEKFSRGLRGHRCHKYFSPWTICCCMIVITRLVWKGLVEH